jgi:uncharacterized protein (DUF2062 family)
MLRQMLRRLKKLYFKLLRLAFYSEDSQHRVAMGAFWGMFWGLTPTVGIQITILTVQCAIFFALNRLSKGKLSWLPFSLPLAIGCTWLSNPANMILLYFSFYYVGALVLPGWEAMGWSEFSNVLKPLLSVDGFSSLKQGLVDLGTKIVYPMVMGSLFIAIPSAIASYFGVRYILSKFAERRKAAKAKRQLLRV